MPESYMGWFHNTSYEKDDIIKEFYLDVRYKVIDMAVQFSHFFVAPAYTLDELMDWLPCEITRKEDSNNEVEYSYAPLIDVSYDFILHKINSNLYRAIYTWSLNEYDEDLNDDESDEKEFLKLFDDPNPCIAVGKLLVWCIKENYLK